MLNESFYSQRGEDKKIAELLGEGYQERKGFYVDVGAWEPELDSITKHFYDLGWTGINIEPVEYYIQRLSLARPKDINLACAVSDTYGELPFYEIPNTGLSTFRDDYGKEWQKSRPAYVHTVPTRTLTDILDEHAQTGKEIDFLKIDVEGWEKQVLNGLDFKKYRPLVIVVEATIPGTETPAWRDWEPIILAEKYQFVHYDNLNRFYVRRDV